MSESESERENLSLAAFASYSRKGRRLYQHCDFEFSLDASHFPKNLSLEFEDCVFHDSIEIEATTVFYNQLAFSGCKFLKVVSFECGFRGSLTFEGVCFEGRVSLRDCVFRKPVEFNEVQFKSSFDFPLNQVLGSIEFSQVAFSGAADFRETAFKEKTLFEKCSFHEGAEFLEVKSIADLKFLGSTFTKAAAFTKAVFSTLSFTEVNFEQGVDFQSAQLEVCNFNGLIGKGKTSFTATHFKGDVIFSACELTDASFDSSLFTRFVSLSETQFKGISNFNSTKFEGQQEWKNCLFELAYFEFVYFKNKVIVENSTFESRASFHQLYAGDYFDFVDVRFQDETDFLWARFEKPFTIESCHFEQGFSAESARFHDTLDFRHSDFKGEVSFFDSLFQGKAHFLNFHSSDDKNSGIDLGYTTFESELNIHRCSLQQLALAGSRYPFASFMDSEVHHADRETFRMIKDSFERVNDKIQAHRYYAKEMNAYLDKEQLSFSDKAILWLTKSQTTMEPALDEELYSYLLRVSFSSFSMLFWIAGFIGVIGSLRTE